MDGRHLKRKEALEYLRQQGSERFISAKAKETWEGVKDLHKSATVQSLFGKNTVRMFGPVCCKREAAYQRWLWGEDIDLTIVDDFVADFEAVEGDVTILVNSGGGNVIEASVMRSAVQERIKDGYQVTVHNVGMMGSAATYIANDAQKYIISDTASFMIHESRLFNVNAGDYRADELRELAQEANSLADWLDGINDKIRNTYERQTGKTEKELKSMMRKETFLVGEDAVEQGFFDELYTVTEEEKAKVENAAREKAEAENIDNFLKMRQQMRSKGIVNIF